MAGGKTVHLANLIEAQQLTLPLIFSLFNEADKLRKGAAAPFLKGKILATLFYEASTRTRLSFESAMLKLGGSVITTENAKEFSSAVKGESLEDTIRIVSTYADCIALRHHEEGAAKRAVKVSDIPIINAGDGRGQHPTQALLDLYTIHRETGRLDNLNVAIIGDLTNGRTARSLCYLLGKCSNVGITFVSPESLRIGADIRNYLKRHNVKFHDEKEMNVALPKADIIYMTRIQKERMPHETYKKVKGIYRLDMKNLNLVRKNARILHPLPRIDEIDFTPELERRDPRIAYFRQAENGLYIRMALLKHLLS